MKSIGACVGLFLAGLALPASAQSAEEAATFVLTGVEPGAIMAIGNGEGKWRRMPGAPVIFVNEGLKDAKPVNLTMTTTQVDDCRFEIVSVADVGDEKAVDVLNIKADFSHLSDLAVTDGEIVFTGEGLCVTDKIDQNCYRDVSGLSKSLDTSRLAAAFKKFKETVCKR